MSASRQFEFHHETEVVVLRWSETNKGATITLQLPPLDIGEGHPFKGMEGVRLRMQFDPMLDEPVIEPPKEPATSEEAPARSLPQPPKGRNPDAADRAREAYRADNEMGKAARLAGMLRKDPEYQRWLKDRCGADSDDYAWFQRLVLDVRSCAEIATDPLAYERWKQHLLAFEMATGRAARPS